MVSKRVNNTTGYAGVSKHKKRYRAVVYKAGRQHCVGFFSSPEEAAAARDEAYQQYCSEYAAQDFPRKPRYDY